MDKTRISSFAEHSSFKIQCVFMDEMLDQAKITKKLFEGLDRILNSQSILETFKKKLNTELKQKVIPMHVSMIRERNQTNFLIF